MSSEISVRWPLRLLVLHLAVLTAVIWFVAGGLNPKPDVEFAQRPSACDFLLPDDDLVHLALRDERDAVAQLGRWKACDEAARHPDATRVEAKKVLGPDPGGTWRRSFGLTWLTTDLGLIVTIAFGFAMAITVCLDNHRWRRAAIFSTPIAALYVVADLVENARLHDILDNPTQASNWMPWAAAIKYGALIGAVPIFLVSLLIVAWKVFAKLPSSEGSSASASPSRSRIAARLDAYSEDRVSVAISATSEEPSPMTALGRTRRTSRRARSRRRKAPERMFVGIACSGGGIRSAAFNLGALQALSEPVIDQLPPSSTTDPAPPVPDPAPPNARPTELSRARWLTSVSGGSYIAAAWITARQGNPGAWARGSLEEQHLRRHASYIAPGIGGKLWALTRFAFGLLVNVGLVVLAMGVLFLPVGSAVDAFDRPMPLPTSGKITLPDGGCLVRPDGSTVHALRGVELQLGSGATRTLDPTAAPVTTASSPTTMTSSTTPTTLPVTVPANPCKAPSSTPPSDAPRAAAPNGTLPAGAVVLLKLDKPLLVQSLSSAGCDPNALTSSTTSSTTTTTATTPGKTATSVATTTTTAPICAAEAVNVFDFPSGTQLRAAPTVEYTVPSKAVVGPDRSLLKACGGHPCTEFVLPTYAKLAFFFVVGVWLLAGIALVAVRTNNPSLGIEAVVRQLTVVTAFLGALFYVLPALVVWAVNGRWWLQDRVAQASGAGTIAVLFALGAQVVPFLGGAQAADTSMGKVAGWFKTLAARLRPLLIRLAGAVIGPLIVLMVGIAFASYAAQQDSYNVPVGLWLALIGPLAVLLVGADLNNWSLYPFYRDRLQTAFDVDLRGPAQARAPFRDEKLSDLPTPPAQPELIICAAANLADDRMTSPGRPVTSWVFTKDLIGSTAMKQAIGGAHTRAVGQYAPAHLTGELEYLSRTWTAVAVSGAAFSPAMGKMNRPERFLLALGNLRLGVWYPNPRYLGDADSETWYATHRPSPWYLVKEAIGRHGVEDRWVYVTDGGHYENLGLRELLDRRPREIYCFDASGDSADTFGTLSDAMRLAREEANIEIDLYPPKAMHPDKKGVSKIGLWAGTVNYPPTEDDPTPKAGWIVIGKLSVPSTAPFDIIDLARTLPSFPNHPTADQLYTDQKFEAYRALGHHLGAVAGWMGAQIREEAKSATSMKAAVRTVTDKLDTKEKPDSPPANGDGDPAADDGEDPAG